VTGDVLGPATMVVRPIHRVAQKTAASITAEGRRLLRFLDPGSGADVLIEPVD